MNWLTKTFTNTANDDDADASPRTVAAGLAKVPPVSALTLKVTPRHAVIGTSSEMSQSQLCATITARDPPMGDEEHRRAPVDIVVALDVSDSMYGEKMALCKESLELLLRSLLHGDCFGLVIFSDVAEVKIPMQEFTAEQKEQAINLVKSLETRCATNISGAICLAADMMNTVVNPNPVRAIFLLTDGFTNRGVRNCPDLVTLAQSQCRAKVDTSASCPETLWACTSPRQVRDMPPEVLPKEASHVPPIAIHCFGCGSKHDSKILQGISLATPGGSYYFVEDDSDVITAFGDALGGVFSVVAQNVVLTIDIPQESRELGVEIVQVHHKNKVERPDKSYSVDIGDFYAEESRDVLFEVTLADPTDPVDYWITHATASISYTDTLSNEFVVCKPIPCDIARITGSAISRADQHIKVQWLRVCVTEMIEEADVLAANGNVEAAQVVIDNTLEAIRMSSDDVRWDELVKQLAENLHRCREGLKSYDIYLNYGTHTMRNALQSHGSQRCMDSFRTHRRNVYRGSLKTKTICAFHNHSV